MSQIILIEDDLFFSSKIENILKNSEYDLKIFPRGIEALKSLRENPAILILINLASHSLNPLKLISEIKADPDLKIIPISGYCGHTQKELVEKARNLGCDKMVPNSVMVSALPKLLNQLFQAKI